MSGILRHHDEDSFVRCAICGGDAAGPCMKCRRSVCGDCCVLVQGAAQQWAVCLRCEKDESSVVGGWRSLGLFFTKLLAVLLAVVVFLAWLAGDLG